MRLHLMPVAVLALAVMVLHVRSSELSAATRTPSGFGILYSVNTTSDTVVVGACQNGLAGCSLRGAIQAANAQPNGSDGIALDLPAGSVINLASALPAITDNVDIFGAGASMVTVRRNTGGNYPIFTRTGGTVSFSGMTISDGAGNDGGGIDKTGGVVTVADCVFVGNVAQNGGGISNRGGTLNVSNCTFSSNVAGSNGGGIANDFFGILNVSNCTFSANIANGGDPGADGGGAICNGNFNHSNGGFLTLTNCTITGNSALKGGGVATVAAFAGGSMTVTNSTIVGNVSSFTSTGGGIHSDSTGPVNIKNTIVALSGGTVGRDVSGIFVSSGFNMIGRVDGASGFTAATDQLGTLALPLDPKLDPSGLRNNGGPTQTIGLLLGSPAIDRGTSNGLTGALTTDQRGSGFPRAVDYPIIANAAGGDGTDIGAIEFGGPLVPISSSRKMHGATPFDVQLPLTGTPGTECRTGGINGDHQVIMNFPGNITATSASITSGTGSVGGFNISGSQATANLTGVANAQTIVLTLSGVSNGGPAANVSIPMGVLVGDTTANRSVNTSDIGQVKSQSGQPVGAANFRTDVTVSGSINTSDIGLVKSNAGTGLP